MQADYALGCIGATMALDQCACLQVIRADEDLLNFSVGLFLLVVPIVTAFAMLFDKATRYLRHTSPHIRITGGNIQARK